MKKIYTIIITSILSLGGYTQPANDDCSGSIPLVLGEVTCGYDNTTSTVGTEPTTFSCTGFTSAGGQWFSFTTSATATSVGLTITEGSSGFIQTLVYSGTCGGLTQIQCVTNSGTSNNVTLTGLSPSTTYYILVASDVGFPSTNFCVGFSEPPVNDVCATAIPIVANTGCTGGNSILATDESAGCASSQYSATWFSVEAINDTMIVSTDFNGPGMSMQNMGVGIFSGSCGSLTSESCVNYLTSTSEANAEAVTVQVTGLTVGDIYYIQVGVTTTTDSYQGGFCVTAHDPIPANTPTGTCCDDPHVMYPSSTACSVTSYDGHVNVADLAGNGNCENIDGSCTTDDDSGQNAYWIEFTANSTTTTLTNLTSGGGQADADYVLYTGACGSLTQVGCANALLGGSSTSLTTVIGTTYLVMVTPCAGCSKPGSEVSVCLQGALCTPPANDACANAETIVVDGGATTETNACSTSDERLCAGSTEANVWYEVTVPDPTDWTNLNVLISSQDCTGEDFAQGASTGAGLQISVYTAATTCANMDAIPSSAGQCGLYASTASNTNFYGSWIPEAGATYLINVDGFGGDVCTFDISVTSTFPTPVPVLAIAFNSFNAELTSEENVELTWSSTDESDISYFEVQRSDDGFLFKKIAEVPNMGGEIIYIDNNPIRGESYYRILASDGTGKGDLSPIKRINYENFKDAFGLYPNPSEGDDMLIFNNSESNLNAEIKIYDITGKERYTDSFESKANDSYKLDTGDLSKGVYIVEILSNGKVQTSRYIKK